MKKILTVFVILLILILSGCACKHQWVDANCTAPKTCSNCQETEDEPLGHNWLDATCTTAKTCSKCQVTEGAPLGHSWLAATCSAPKTCEVCAATVGETLPHDYEDATCTAPKTCKKCNATEGEALGHKWTEATYSAPKTCDVCGATEGMPLFRKDLGMSCSEMELGLSVSLQLLGCKLDYLGIDEYGCPVYDILNSSGAYTNTYICFEPTEDGKAVYSLLICAEDPTDVTAVALLGAVGGIALQGIDSDFDTDLLQETLQGTPEVEDGVTYYYMEDCGLVVDMQVHPDYVLFWIYPVEQDTAHI